MFNASLFKVALVVLLFVQPDDSGNANVLEDGDILAWMVAITVM